MGPDPMFVRQDDERERYNLYMEAQRLRAQLKEMTRQRDEIQVALSDCEREVVRHHAAP